MSTTTVETHPVQGRHQVNRLPIKVTMAAYEVYCHVYSSQEAMVTGECRGGFTPSEIIAFLYAKSFPKEEWDRRVQEALNGMEST